jgi:hypothetical protein
MDPELTRDRIATAGEVAASQAFTGNCYTYFPLKNGPTNSHAGSGEFADDSAR